MDVHHLLHYAIQRIASVISLQKVDLIYAQLQPLNQNLLKICDIIKSLDLDYLGVIKTTMFQKLVHLKGGQ